MLKIGLVLSKPPAYSETFFISKIKGLQEGGHSVMLFVQKEDKEFSLCPVLIAPKVFKKNLLFQLGINILMVLKLLGYSKRVLKFIKLEKEALRSNQQILKNIFNNSHILRADIDWLHFGFATMALQSEHVAKAIEAKMAVSFRGFDIVIYPVKHTNCYHLLWKNIDKVHTISDYLIQIAYKLGMQKETLYDKITPAIDIQKFNPIVKNQDFERNSIQFLTIARLHWIKGINYTLEALAKIKEEGIDFTYTIVGDGVEYENIAFAIYQLKLSNYVRLLGRKDATEIVELLKRSDVYLQYSLSEGFCNTVLEAQALGLLCIVSNAGGLQENILHSETGWIVPKRNPKLLAKTIMDVIHLPLEEKQQISKNAQERIKKSFAIEQQQQEFVEFYGN